MKCDQCNRRVKDTFQAKWNHMVKYHPVELGTRILPLAFQPQTFETVGHIIAEYAKTKLQSGVR